VNRETPGWFFVFLCRVWPFDADPPWASLNRGLLICSECASIHRTLGRHVSRVAHFKRMNANPRLTNVSRSRRWTMNMEMSNDYLPVSASCVTISNPDSLSTSKTWINLGMRSWRNDLSEWARCLKAIGGTYFTKKGRAKTPQPGLDFDNCTPWLKTVIFRYISWLNGSLFEGVGGFPK
jgi:hypothetical protein